MAVRNSPGQPVKIVYQSVCLSLLTSCYNIVTYLYIYLEYDKQRRPSHGFELAIRLAAARPATGYLLQDFIIMIIIDSKNLYSTFSQFTEYHFFTFFFNTQFCNLSQKLVDVNFILIRLKCNTAFLEDKEEKYFSCLRVRVYVYVVLLYCVNCVNVYLIKK